LTHNDGQFDQLPFVEPLGEREPGCIGNHGIAMQLIDCSQDGAFMLIQALCARTADHARNVVAGEAKPLANHDMLAPLVRGLTQPRDSQDGEFAIAER
jgi:hypothetical protein